MDRINVFYYIGHFTQSVWKDTKEIGIAYAWNTDKNQNFVVASYIPQGNYPDEYVDNVLPLIVKSGEGSKTYPYRVFPKGQASLLLLIIIKQLK